MGSAISRTISNDRVPTSPLTSPGVKRSVYLKTNDYVFRYPNQQTVERVPLFPCEQNLSGKQYGKQCGPITDDEFCESYRLIIKNGAVPTIGITSEVTKDIRIGNKTVKNLNNSAWESKKCVPVEGTSFNNKLLVIFFVRSLPSKYMVGGGIEPGAHRLG